LQRGQATPGAAETDAAERSSTRFRRDQPEPQEQKVRVMEQAFNEQDDQALLAMPAARPTGAEAVVTGSDDTVVVLPLRETEDGVGIYPEATVTFVKRLRADGTDARYLHPPELRMFEGRKEFVAAAVVTIVLGIISSGAWEGIKRLLDAGEARRMKVTFGRREDGHGGSVTWWQSEGPPEAVIESIDRLMRGRGSLDDGGRPQIPSEDDTRRDREDPAKGDDAGEG
jgi:hypothetical protein